MSVLAGLDAIFDQHLGVEDIGASSPHHRHVESALRLSAGRPIRFQALQLLQDAYTRLLLNLEGSPRFSSSGASKENWRFERRLGYAPENSSPEVTLEREIVRVMGEDWANQVPAASGLWNGAADKRRAVDLVVRVGEQCFELIELKVESDTPLRAAVEILQYGLLYALARDRYPETQHAGKDLLRATNVHLCVLAPLNYYAPYALAWLEHDLDVGLRSFALERFGIPLLSSFSFHEFPDDFSWPCSDDVLREHVRQRRRIWLAQPPAQILDQRDGALPQPGPPQTIRESRAWSEEHDEFRT